MHGQSYRCGPEAALDVTSGTWKVAILWQRHPQPRHSGELKRWVLGISEKMRIPPLRELAADGIRHRKVHHEGPPKVESSLTVFGASLNTALTALCA